MDVYFLFFDIVVTQLHTFNIYLYHTPVGFILSQCEHSSTSERASWDEQCHTSDMDFINDDEDISQGEPPCMDYLNSSIENETPTSTQQLQSTHIGVPPTLNLGLSPIRQLIQKAGRTAEWAGDNPQFTSQKDAFESLLLTRGN